MPPTRISGRKIIATKAIPKPPSQFNNPRHRLVPVGKASSPIMTVDPVPVMPDTASKYASVDVSCGAPK